MFFFPVIKRLGSPLKIPHIHRTPPHRLESNHSYRTPRRQQDGARMRTLCLLGLALVGMTQVSAFVAPAAGPLQARRAGAPTSSSSSSLLAPQPLVPIASPSSLLSAVSEPNAESKEAMDAAGADVLKTEVGMDYVPLANMLLVGDFQGADQFTRDALIKIAGPAAQKRGYVYFTEVKNLPRADMATIERLWLKYSKGKFGFTVQKAVWKQASVNGDFERFCRKIGWNLMENGIERKRRWFGKSEFFYTLDPSVPAGHLPLTSALRGTSLLKNLLQYPLWDEPDWQKWHDSL